MERNYNTSKLTYGVTARIGRYIVGKLRLREDNFEIVESYLKRYFLDHQVVKRNIKINKYGKETRYVHFTFALTDEQFRQVMILIRKERVKKIEYEINNLLLW